MTQATKASAPDLETIREAHKRIAPHIHRTPVMTSASLDEIAGAKLSVTSLRADTMRYAERLETQARKCFAEWLTSLD